MPLSEFIGSNLIQQTANAIRHSIKNGDLTNPFPGETKLSEQMGISRPTLRKALEILKNEGYLKIEKGKRTLLLPNFTKATIAQNTHRICAVGPFTRSADSLDRDGFIQMIQLQLLKKGIEWEQYFDSTFGREQPDEYLSELVKNRPGRCWLLFCSTPQIQRFFAKTNLPVLIIGSCHHGINLPAVNWNYKAVGRHIAGALLARGHRHVTLINPIQMGAGDMETHAGLEEVFQQTKYHNTILSTLAIADSQEEFSITFKRYMNQKTRPTALIILRIEHLLSAITLAPTLGLKIPKDFSIIYRDNHPVLKSIYPEIAHYSISGEKQIKLAMRLMQSLLTGRRIEPITHYLTPDLILGQSLYSIQE